MKKLILIYALFVPQLLFSQIKNIDEKLYKNSKIETTENNIKIPYDSLNNLSSFYQMVGIDLYLPPNSSMRFYNNTITFYDVNEIKYSKAPRSQFLLSDNKLPSGIVSGKVATYVYKPEVYTVTKIPLKNQSGYGEVSTYELFSISDSSTNNKYYKIIEVISPENAKSTLKKRLEDFNSLKVSTYSNKKTWNKYLFEITDDEIPFEQILSKQYNILFIKLLEKVSGDTVYIKVSRLKEFVPKGFYEKIKQVFEGKELINCDPGYSIVFTDAITQESICYFPSNGLRLMCREVALFENNVVLILEDPDKKTFAIKVTNLYPVTYDKLPSQYKTSKYFVSEDYIWGYNSESLSSLFPEDLVEKIEKKGREYEMAKQKIKIVNEGDHVQGKTVKDIDGNIYNTVIIGTQVWMRENLKTTKYRNGNLIGTTTPATLDITDQTNPKYQWAYLGNESYVATYGRLYTWYAATDSSGICPAGWHVPSKAEWTTLATYLGGESVAGGKLKETGTIHWLKPNIGATNETSFTALPVGFRSFAGLFFYRSNSAWWSSTSETAISAWYQSIQYDYSEIIPFSNSKAFGFSVRCVKDRS